MHSSVSPLWAPIASNSGRIWTDNCNECAVRQVSADSGAGLWSAMLVITAYLYSIKVIGPEMMPHRKTYYLKNSVLLAKLAIVVLSTWIIVESYFFDINGRNRQIGKSLNHGTRLSMLGMLYMTSKFIELADSVLMIAHKKSCRLPALHFLSHAAVPLMVWIGFKLLANATVAFLLVHSAVHTLMHAYYNTNNLQDLQFDEAVANKVIDDAPKAHFSGRNVSHKSDRPGRCRGQK